MKTIHLFRIYHSFLLKKWYLIIYLLFILAALLITLTTIQHVTEDDNHFNIGVVDKDQSSETKLILNSIGKGSNLGKNVSIKGYDEKKAHDLLKQQKLQSTIHEKCRAISANRFCLPTSYAINGWHLSFSRLSTESITF